ncbi:hypothetical protein ACIBBB_29830 [Streptomyces sp. NPDC051217]|uniref:hypothetical protein n=1 Tax=Streptomyces sp. NPDC051217 TaxID=3365644 RepID=UPI0037A09C4C
MTASDMAYEERRRADSIAALCALLAERNGLWRTDSDVARATERARDLLDPDSTADPDQLDAAFGELDEALLRGGDARGLGGHLRVGAGQQYPGQAIPGVHPMIKVALCPGTVLCTRREPAKDLRPAPPCALNGGRMRKERLRRDPTA